MRKPTVFLSFHIGSLLFSELKGKQKQKTNSNKFEKLCFIYLMNFYL